MGLQFKPSSLKQTKWYEYLIRFVFGGLITVATGIITQKYGPVVGGLFLAFPSIFPASVTLVQSHKKESEQKEGEPKATSEREGRKAAGITALGSAMGSLGLLGFAMVLWQMSTHLADWLVLVLAMLVWLVVNVLVWWIQSKINPGPNQAE